MKHTLVLVCALVASASCQRSDPQEEQTLPVLPAPPPTLPSAPNPPLSSDSDFVVEDRVNTSGRDEGAAAGIDESAEHGIAASRELAAPGELSTDRAIRQRIRQALLDDGSFSSSAKSINIETVAGVVTLSGAVRSNQERAQLTTLASAMTGVKRVDNQLRIGSD